MIGVVLALHLGLALKTAENLALNVADGGQEVCAERAFNRGSTVEAVLLLCHTILKVWYRIKLEGNPKSEK